MVGAVAAAAGAACTPVTVKTFAGDGDDFEPPFRASTRESTFVGADRLLPPMTFTAPTAVAPTVGGIAAVAVAVAVAVTGVEAAANDSSATATVFLPPRAAPTATAVAGLTFPAAAAPLSSAKSSTNAS